MYIPKKYLEEDREKHASLIKAYPLATVVTSGEGGIIANHIPFYLHVDKETGRTYLQGHIARVNHQIGDFRKGEEVLVIFQSSDAYISPSYYPTKHETGKFVPTWDFATIHCYGAPRVVDDPEWVHKQLNNFTNQQEIDRPTPWKVSDAPESYIRRMQMAITGLEIEITKIEGKFKFDQGHKRVDIDGVIDGLTEDKKCEVAKFVKEANADK